MGKIEPERIANSDYIDVNTASKKKYLNLSRRQVSTMCERGIFKSAFKGGTQSKTSKWQLLRSEVIQHKLNGQAFPQY